MQSLVSPLEVSVREPAVCASCTTKDCIRGSDDNPGLRTAPVPAAQARQPGLHVLPRLRPRLPARQRRHARGRPGQTLWSDPLRSGIGRFSRRPDLAALVLVLVFGAFANAAGMVRPVVEWQDQLRVLLGNPPQLLVTTIGYFAAIVVLPLAAVGSAAAMSRLWGTSDRPLADRGHAIFVRARPARLRHVAGPLQFSLSHKLRHDHPGDAALCRRPAAGMRWASRSGNAPAAGRAAEWIPHLEILMLDFGLLLSLYTGFRIAETNTTRVVTGPEGVFALGAVDVAVVRVRSLDCVSAHGNARHPACRGLSNCRDRKLLKTCDIFANIVIAGCLLVGPVLRRRVG